MFFNFSVFDYNWIMPEKLMPGAFLTRKRSKYMQQGILHSLEFASKLLSIDLCSAAEVHVPVFGIEIATE